MPTLPTICRVVYDTDPPTPDPDDDPLTPYRFSFLKSYSSSNFSGRTGERHSRFHGNSRHPLDSQVLTSTYDRRCSGKTESGRFLRRDDGERNERYGMDLSRWIAETDSPDVPHGPLLLHCGIDAEETEEDGWKDPTGSRKPTRLLWDPINNAWISQDPKGLVYLHFTNGLSLADRGIYSNRTILERRARFYPCMEKHLKSLDDLRRMTAGANASMIWATQHRRRRGPTAQHQRRLQTLKGFTSDEHRSGGSSESSLSTAVRGLTIAEQKDETDDEQIERKDIDSTRGNSATTCSLDGRVLELVEGWMNREEDDEEEELDEDPNSSPVIDGSIEEDVDDFNSLDGQSRSGTSDERRSELGGSEDDDGSESGSTRTRLRRRVRIDESRRDSTNDEPEILPDRRIIEQKIRQQQEKERGDGKGLEKSERLRTLRRRSNRQGQGEDSEEERETDATRTRKQRQELEIVDSLSTESGSLSNGCHGHRISRVQVPLPGIQAEPRPDSAAEGRHPMRRRPSWLQRMRRKQGRRVGILRQRMGSRDDTEENSIDLRFEDYDWLAKYCILDPKTVTICKQIFDEVDENRVGRLTCHQTMVALRASNYKLTDMLEQYMYTIMEMTGYEIENGADYRLFCVLAALSQRITAVEEWMKCLINKMDMKTLEAKLFVCKTLWECSVDAETKTISLDDLCVELRAGGVSYEHEQHVREKLQHLRHLDLLDFLAYVPLFIMIHESVVDNPLDDRRYK